jgi:hypothetical protein
VFGSAQSRLTQALRRKLAPPEIFQLIATLPKENYADRLAGYDKLHAHLDRVLKAAAHVLLQGAAAEQAANVVSLHAGDAADDYLAQYEDGLDGRETVTDEAMAASMDEARKAFRSLSRAGFDDDALDDPDLIEGFRMAVAALTAIRDDIDGYRKIMDTVDCGEPGLDGWFASDCNVFRERFTQIYGALE